LPGLQCDIGDLSGARIDLIEGAGTKREDLHSIEVAGATRLNARSVIGGLDPRDRLLCLNASLLASLRWRPGRRDVQGSRTILRLRRRTWKWRDIVVVADLRRFGSGAAAERKHAGKQKRTHDLAHTR